MDDKEQLPRYSRVDELVPPLRPRPRASNHRRRRTIFRILVLFILGFAIYAYRNPRPSRVHIAQTSLSIERLQANHAHCVKLRAKPQDPSGPREQNARYNGAPDVLIKGATVWTGEPSKQVSEAELRAGVGLEWRQLDVLLHNGLITRVAEDIALQELSEHTVIWNGTGRLLTAGIVDMHSHAGVSSLPDTRGGNDDNELSNDITPYVRSLDAINPLDHQIQVIKSGGVTTSLILPGSGNNMGGEAFVIKHAVGKADGRPELSAESMLADQDHNWRYMKMACGENAKSVYGKVGRDFGPFSRMGEAWYFRHAFEQAKRLVDAQDEWCDAADRLGAENMNDYLPLDLQWESLGALLRGQVYLNTHCYTVPDLEAFIRHSNEFKFSVRAFHHAHQTYLVPEILNRNYGGRPPAAALFADNMYYKMESYIGSEQAGKILHDSGITPVYVSDNPVINAQHVVFEAAKAYKNGLPYHVALAGVTSASAELLGLGERIGKIKERFDADVVLWDSDPLSVGATPVQVWIDGAEQFKDPVELIKPAAVPLKHMQMDGTRSEQASTHTSVCFSGIVSDVIGQESNADTISINKARSALTVEYSACPATTKHIKLDRGYIVRPATAFGSYLGLQDIQAESSTNDGYTNADSFGAAVDGLFFDTKGLKAAFSHGVTRAITAPPYSGDGHKGTSVGFRINAKHALEERAVWSAAASVHYSLTDGVKDGQTPSIAIAVAELRGKLIAAIEKKEKSNVEEYSLAAVVAGELALVVDVHKTDTIAALIKLKETIDTYIETSWTGKAASPKLRLVIMGAAEAHLLADELAKADIGVVLAPAFPYAVEWEQRRSLTGAPLTNGTALDVLHAANVTVAIGTAEDWETRDLFLTAGIALVNSGGRISGKEALDLVSTNIYKMLGIESALESGYEGGFVVYDGNPLEIQSRVRAVYDGSGKIHVWA